jgi:hypothetical protein
LTESVAEMAEISGCDPDCPASVRARTCLTSPDSKDRDMFDKAMTKSIQAYLQPGE